MIGLALKLAKTKGFLPMIGAGALFAFSLGLAVAVTHEHKAPWGLAAKLKTAREATAAAERKAWGWYQHALGWRAAYDQEKRAFDESERLRLEYEAAAATAVADLNRTCAARVDEARRSATAIRSLITKEPARDPVSHCPSRELADPGELWDAIVPPEHRSAARAD